MLEKMGWKRGDGLGKDGKGMKDPVRLFEKRRAGPFIFDLRHVSKETG